jgi:hypothetical protein
MKKSVKLACHAVNSNIAIGYLPTLQISLGIVALFEKIYDSEPILTVVSNNEHFRENSLQQDLSNDSAVNPSLFSWVNTFKGR